MTDWKEFPKIDTGEVGGQQPLFDLMPPLFVSEPVIEAPHEEKSNEPTTAAPDGNGIIKPNDKLEANSAHPASVRGSDEGRAESEAAGEGSAKT